MIIIKIIFAYADDFPSTGTRLVRSNGLIFIYITILSISWSGLQNLFLFFYFLTKWYFSYNQLPFLVTSGIIISM